MQAHFEVENNFLATGFDPSSRYLAVWASGLTVYDIESATLVSKDIGDESAIFAGLFNNAAERFQQHVHESMDFVWSLFSPGEDLLPRAAAELTEDLAQAVATERIEVWRLN